ncbi:MAG: 2-oxoacid:acceptor oxidoreductase family protein [archaeon]
MDIIIKGRGGQGAVKAAQLLAISAFISGYEAQAFPMFGVERRGAPVSSFVRIDKKQIRTRAQIERADYAIVLDSTLLDAGRINAKNIVVNSGRTQAGCKGFDADAIALKIFAQGVNTVMVAAFAFFSGIISQENLIQACREVFDAESGDKNIQIVKETFSQLEKSAKRKK